MKIKRESIDKNRISRNGIPEDALFLDIETTGLSPRNAFIYMMGMVYFDEGTPCFESITAECAAQEEELLIRFTEILKRSGFLIHYNGDKFDLPFIGSRARAYGMDVELSGYPGIDLYKQVKPLKSILGLPGCKQKDIERFLGVDREDKYSGKELINVYKQYSETRDEALYSLLYQHNHDDVTGMLDILPILAYNDIFEGKVDIGDIKRSSYTDTHGIPAEELLINLKFHSPLPSTLCINSNGIYLTAKGDTGTLKLPVYNGELKYFYDDPREYYYLPGEDMAVHKSVAQYVDKEYRRQAKPSNCYTRKTGVFLPEHTAVFTPVFMKEYNSVPLFFELTEDFDLDSPKFRDYLIGILQQLR